MNLHRKLLQRQAAGKPLRIGVIGAGKFGTMYLAQARKTPGIHLVGVADLSVSRAREALKRTGWTDERVAALMGTAIPIPSADHERIEAAVRDEALAYGPEPSRPAHRTPRTPGRRRLISPRIAARKAYPIR